MTTESTPDNETEPLADDDVGALRTDPDVRTGAAVDEATAQEEVVARDEPEFEEIVGPGKFPLRIQPAAAIMPAKADARRLLRIWFVRKSVYWMGFLGIAIGAALSLARQRALDADLADVEKAWTGGFILLLVAVAVRFIVNWIALGMAFPLALAHEPSLSPRDNFGSGIGKFFDRLHVARAFRALRWTHHVRQVAQHRLGEEGRRLGRLDPIFDIVNIASGVIGIGLLMLAVGLNGAGDQAVGLDAGALIGSLPHV